MDKDDALPAVEKNSLKSTELNLNTSLVFPTEFRYEFDSLDSDFSSPVESVLCSTESETTSDEEDFLAELTRRLTHSSTRKLEKSCVVAGSPESTLSGLRSISVSSNGSPNGYSSLVSSPPATMFGGHNDTWDLISAAAGQIARLKMSNCSETVPNYTTDRHARGLHAPPNSSGRVHVVENRSLRFYPSRSVNFERRNSNECPQCVKHQEQMLKAESREQVFRPTWVSSQPQQTQNKSRSFGYENERCGQQTSQSAWPHLQILQQKPQQQRPVFVGGSSCVKRECAGTGVFLPRSYGNNNNNPHDSRRKSGNPNVLVPHVQQSLHSSSFGPNYDAIIARNALITSQKGSLRAEAARNQHEIRLPKEWTY